MNLGIVTVWTPSEIQAQMQSTLASAQETNTSVTGCTNLGSTISSAWTTFYNALTAFCSQTPAILPFGSNEVLASGTTVDQLQSYQAQLYAWQQKLSPTCTSVVPVAPPSSSLFNSLTNAAPTWTPILKWTTLGIAALASAFVVAKVAEIAQDFAPPRRPSPEPVRAHR